MSTEKKKKPLAKKIIKATVITITVLLIALVCIPFLFKDKIVQMIKNTANNNINATITFNETDLSLFRDFPNASLQINDIAIINKAPFKGDTLFFSKKLNINLKVTELFKNESETLDIEGIAVENSLVNIFFNKENKGNYDIALEKENTPKDTTSTGVSLNIKSYRATNLKFIYFDESSQIKLKVDSIYHSGTGNFAQEVLDLDTKTSAKVSFDLDKINYLNNVDVQLDAILGIDLKNTKYTFKENTGYINQLPLEFSGFIQLVDENQLYDIDFKTPTSSFKNLLALVPKQYSGNLNDVKTAGNFDLKGTVKGTYSEKTIPNLDISFSSKNAMFKYTDLPKAVNNINLNANIINKTGFLKDTYVNIHRASFTIDKDVFNANGSVANFTVNPLINLKANGTINLENISKVYPVQLENELSGILKANVTTNFDMNSVEKGNYQNIKNSGALSLSNFKYDAKDVANPFFIDKTEVIFNTKTINLKEFKAKTGSSDLSINGNLYNFYGFLFNEQKLKGNFDLKSNNFKVDDFLSKEENTKENNETTTLKIPAFLDINLNANATNVVYDNINLKNVTGNLSIKDEAVRLQNVSSSVFKGTIDFDGKVSTKNNTSTFNMALKLKELNIEDSFSSLEMLKAIAPIAKTIGGKINSNINVSGNLSDSMTPVLTSISGDLFGKLLDPKLNTANSKVLSAVSSKVDFLDLDKLNLDGINAFLTFNNGEVALKPIKLNYKDIDIEVDGKHGFDNKMNYNLTFNLPVKYLGTTVTNAIAKLTAKDAAEIKTIPVNALLTGSFSSPNFSTDIKSATSNLMKTIVEKQKQNLVDKGKDKLLDLLGGNKDKKDSTKTKETTKDKVKDVLGGLFGKKKKDTTKNN
ncbi:AsmA family protein [Polaribacter sp.]|uniref:AsmA family protein n=1 Tax=Polaribacter sp. TaxID=1920175 RepID=UPI003F6D2E70